MNRIWTEQLQIVKTAAEYTVIDILGLPYGGPMMGKDLHGEFLTPRTVTEKVIGDTIPTSYFHGLTPEGIRDKTPEFFEKAELVRVDEKGGWFRVKIDFAKKHANRILKSLENGTLRGSTGIAGNLRMAKPNGELTLWVPGELGLIDQKFEKQLRGGMPRIVSNNFAIALPALKMLYDDGDIEWPEVLQEEERREDKSIKLILAEEKNE